MTAAERIERDSDMHRIYIHPLPVRIWHWINALGFVLMVLTGLQIRYVGLINVVSFRTAVTVHNTVGFVLIANFFVWLLFYLFSDRIKVYHPESPRKHFPGAFRQAYYYGYGIFKGDPNPFHVSIYRKFNPLQSMTYQVILMLLVPIQFYTGILMWDVKRFSAQVDFFGGVRVIDTVHVLIFIIIVFYLFVHVYLSTLGKTRLVHFKEMLTGYEEIEEEPAAVAPESAPSGGARNA
jgi:thiosulfate reductase cytochrome b subunit